MKGYDESIAFWSGVAGVLSLLNSSLNSRFNGYQIIAINAKKIDCFVLGCTHYSLVENKISRYLKKKGFKGLILNSNKILIQYIKDEFH